MENTRDTAILSATGLTVQFGGLSALSNVNINVMKGDIHGLIGPNGAGKTTFTNTVSGLLEPTKGEIRFRDRVINNLEPHIITSMGISRTFQKAQILPGLNCLQNVMTGRHSRIKSNIIRTLILPRCFRKGEEKEIRDRSYNLLELVGLSESAERSGGDLSWVECQLLQIARSLASDPKLVILDEPTAGMGHEESRLVGEIIKKIRDSGITVILISHDVRLVMQNADQVTVLDFGEKICEGTPDKVKDDPRVLEAYLGTE